MDELQGSVTRITYVNEENGYTVLRLKPDKEHVPGLSRDGLVTVVGTLPEISPGEHLSLEGQWSTHSQYGTQFAVEVCKQTLPATVEGIKRYLGSGLIKGIGPQLAERIVDHLGENALDVIEHQPRKLQEVSGIGPHRSAKIRQAWEEQKDVKEIMIFLHGHGISTNLAVKIYKEYGDKALQVVRNDPYQLERDIYGIGFKTADSIAQNLGLPADHPSRIEAGVIYALNEMINEGHVYAPRELLIERAIELLASDPEQIKGALKRLAEADRIRADQVPIPSEPGSRGKSGQEHGLSDQASTVLYLTPFYHAEKGVAERLDALAHHLPARLSDIPPAFVENDPALNKAQIILSPKQKTAVHTALSHPVSVLTGGPGTGKTTCLQYLITILDTQNKSYALASPTGRAAKHLSLATDRPASTIHRLLGYSPAEGFKHDQHNPLPIDILVVDEASMLDLLLTYNLLKALEPGTHLLLVGDVDQLPSVGAGNVLHDIINSGIAPVTRLQTIFRQAAHSDIITNAHRINRGSMPTFPQHDQSENRQTDFFLFPAKDAAEAANWIIDLVSARIPKEFGLDPVEDVQVLAPMYRGPAGVNVLNQRLQEALNPTASDKPEKSLLGTLYRTGDKVMQIQNNYPKNVYNGDIGTLLDIDDTDQTLLVEFDGQQVTYEWNEGDELMLAYAVSVHKAQGSEFPAVVLPMVTQHYIMLQRNLFYTAITRAQELCVLAGNMRAIAIAVRNNKVSHRFTALDWRLSNLGHSPKNGGSQTEFGENDLAGL